MLSRFEKYGGNDLNEDVVLQQEVNTFLPFNSSQNQPTGIYWIGLSQKKNNPMNSIFGRF